MSGPVSVLPEVAAALAGGRPVVALESTLIAHGLPAPRNLSVALDLEARLRDRGVTPATIGVVDGVPTVGLDRAGLEIMAGAGGGAGPDPGPSGEEPGRGGKEQGHVEEQGRGVAKASVRDLPVLLANGRSAATTVAATSYLAWRAGVRVFATGGLGGVHRGAASSYDESADLVALSRTPVAVVCAGVKSILDVAATLERLESLGVTVVGYGTNRFPGFYLHDSGHPVEWRVDGPEAVARVMAAADGLGLTGAVVVANPVPLAEQLDPDLYQGVLAEALAAAEAKGLRGKEVTPFLLDHIQAGTGGASLEANVAAVVNNVEVAAGVARAWAALGPGRGR